MMPAVLLVTWFYSSQPPVNSQTQFSSMETCEIARASIMQDAARLKSDADKEVVRLRAQGTIYNPAIPKVSAVCAAR
jgi:hypothetical protein